MNAQVQSWLDEQKRRRNAAEESLKRTHLIRLGLIDPETKQPYEVSDEEYRQICKYAPTSHEKEDEKVVKSETASVMDDRAEKWLYFFAKLNIVLGAILWVASIVAAAIYGDVEGIPMIITVVAGILGGFIVFAGFCLTWALLKTFANISLRLKDLGR